MFYPVAILLLLVLSAAFSACETAFSSVNKIRLKSDAMQGNQRAGRALELAESFDRALTAILIGNNLVNILSASLGTILFTRWFGQGGVGISTNVGLLLRRCSGKGLHLAMTGEPRGFSRVTAGFSSFDGEFRLPLVCIRFHTDRYKRRGQGKQRAGRRHSRIPYIRHRTAKKPARR